MWILDRACFVSLVCCREDWEGESIERISHCIGMLHIVAMGTGDLNKTGSGELKDAFRDQ